VASSGLKTFAYLVIFFGLGIWAVYSGCREYLLLQKVKNTPTSKVSSTAIGFVELTGRAAIENPLRSPVSKNRCVYWRVTGEYYESGRHGGWRDLYSDESMTHFHIRDDTGDMDVDPQGATIEIEKDRSWEGFIRENRGFFITESGGPMLEDPAKSYISSLKNPYSEKKFERHSDEKIRITEFFIAENDLLYVLGSATPREGVTGPVNHETLIIRKGEPDGTMYITDRSEKQVQDRLFSWAYPKIILGLACSAGCLFGLLMMLETARDALFLLGFTIFALMASVVWEKWESR